jgi:hypothetical protein
MNKFRLSQIGDSAHPYQYYAHAYFWNEALLHDIRAFLIDHTGSGGHGPGDLWWHSEHTNRIYLREKDLSFFLIKFGDRMSPLADQ